MLTLGCIVPSVSTVKENEVDYEEEYQGYRNDWSVHSDDSIISIENYGSVVQYEGSEVSIDNQDFESLDGPMDSAWPMFGHDVTHTCRSLYSTENNSGVEIWRVRGDESGSVWGSALSDNDETIYFGTKGSDSSLYVLYPNGTRKWRFMAADLIWGTPAISEEGIIYFTTWGPFHYFYALNPNGTEKWSLRTEGASISSPSIAGDGTIYFGDDDYIIYAINPNGTEKWRYPTGYLVADSPAIGQDGTIYIGSGDHYLYALYTNGTLRWRFATGSHIKGSASIAPDGTIYVPSFDEYFYAVYPNGTMKWRAFTGSSVAAAGVALAEDGTIYIGTELLRAYYPNGTLRWSADVQGDVYGTVPAVSADGTIYVSAGDSLVAVNPDGSERWRQTLTNEQVRSSPSIGENDRVYVGSTYRDYGYLHAFGPGEPNVPSAPIITGQTNGRIKRTYDYTFTSTSPLGKQLHYLIDWGDGATTDWLGPYNSGEPLTMEHSWSEKGTYNITVRAKDTDNRWGPWGNLSVTMPCSYDILFMNFLEKLLEWCPNAFPILRYFLNK